MIALTCYQMMLFTNWWDDMNYNLKYYSGYVFVGGMGFTLAVNVAAMVKDAFDKKKRDREFKIKRNRWLKFTKKNMDRVK